MFQTIKSKIVQKYKDNNILFIIVIVAIPIAILFSTYFTVKQNPHLIFNVPPILAKSAIVYDLNTNEAVFEKNSEEIRPLASITKIMTVLTAKDIDKNTNRLISIDEGSLTNASDTSGLIDGEVWRLDDLIRLTLMSSSNTGARAISHTLSNNFISLMNKKSESLNLKTFNFKNSSGLDLYDNAEAGAVGSIKDVVSMMEYAYKKYPDLIKYTAIKSATFTSVTGIDHTIENTDKSLYTLDNVIAGKTGYTILAGGNLIILTKEKTSGHIIAIGVLGSTQDGRFTDVELLNNSVKEYFSKKNLFGL